MYSVFTAVLASVNVFIRVSLILHTLFITEMSTLWHMEVLRSQQLTLTSPAEAGTEALCPLPCEHVWTGYSFPLGPSLLSLLSFLLQPVGCDRSWSWLVFGVYRRLAVSFSLLLGSNAAVVSCIFSRVVVVSRYFDWCNTRVLPRFLPSVWLLYNNSTNERTTVFPFNVYCWEICLVARYLSTAQSDCVYSFIGKGSVAHHRLKPIFI